MKAFVVLVLLAVIQAPMARAQSLLSRDEQYVKNFAVATQLGSGAYSVSGRTLQIYRLPRSHTLKSTDDSAFGLERTLPVTFGFLDFELQDIGDGNIPTNVDASSFVPGMDPRAASHLAHTCATSRHWLSIRVEPGRTPNRGRDTLLTTPGMDLDGPFHPNP